MIRAEPHALVKRPSALGGIEADLGNASVPREINEHVQHSRCESLPSVRGIGIDVHQMSTLPGGVTVCGHDLYKAQTGTCHCTAAVQGKHRGVVPALEILHRRSDERIAEGITFGQGVDLTEHLQSDAHEFIHIFFCCKSDLDHG